jgi:hypothetical protein
VTREGAAGLAADSPGRASCAATTVPDQSVQSAPGAITELGRIGLTAVGDSREQAESIFRHAERVILDEASPRKEPALPAV